MAGAVGVVKRGLFGEPYGGTPTNTPEASSPIMDSYKLYNSGVTQQAGDYDNIMSGYDDLISRLKQSSASLQAPARYNPQTAKYAQSSDLTSAISNLKGLADTGGYSDADKNNIRERAISPIRSVYSSAVRGADRNRALSGGYSPNYNAVISKMAREQSDLVSNAITGVNADLAQKVAANRLSIAPTYANVTGEQSNLRNSVNQNNAGIVNDAAKFNIQTPLQFQQMKSTADSGIADALRGKTSLYGQTPALAQLYGQQANTSSQIQNQANQQRNQSGLNLAQIYARG